MIATQKIHRDNNVSPTKSTGGSSGKDQAAPAIAKASASDAALPEVSQAKFRRLFTRRNGIIAGSSLFALLIAGYYLVPIIDVAWNTVSTDDAYINGHVTFVAPRVAGQVAEVLVDDNYRVNAGDVLLRLDKEPLQVIVALKRSLLETAETELDVASADVMAMAAQARSSRF
ncbi:MAG TPA: biotin/lipoyl-binding protein, partial [Pirellulaceae bacterium]|nr:biotin/lipoyl-binding protein [Pirellulaceae bacterium]